MRSPRLRVEGSAGRAPTLHPFLGPGICLTTEENHGKTSVRAPLYTSLTDWFFITVVESVYCAVRTDSLYKADYDSYLKG